MDSSYWIWRSGLKNQNHEWSLTQESMHLVEKRSPGGGGGMKPPIVGASKGREQTRYWCDHTVYFTVNDGFVFIWKCFIVVVDTHKLVIIDAIRIFFPIFPGRNGAEASTSNGILNRSGYGVGGGAMESGKTYSVAFVFLGEWERIERQKRKDPVADRLQTTFYESVDLSRSTFNVEIGLRESGASECFIFVEELPTTKDNYKQ